MKISLNTRVQVPADVYLEEIEGQAVILHITNERYFGLDDIGTRMWHVLTSSPSIGSAVERLLSEFDTSREALEHDILDLSAKLVEANLLSPHES